jgi:hypothetical protein
LRPVGDRHRAEIHLGHGPLLRTGYLIQIQWAAWIATSRSPGAMTRLGIATSPLRY